MIILPIETCLASHYFSVGRFDESLWQVKAACIARHSVDLLEYVCDLSQCDEELPVSEEIQDNVTSGCSNIVAVCIRQNIVDIILSSGEIMCTLLLLLLL